MSYSITELQKKWAEEGSTVTAEQAIGQLLLLVEAQEEQIADLEKRLRVMEVIDDINQRLRALEMKDQRLGPSPRFGSGE